MMDTVLDLTRLQLLDVLEQRAEQLGAEPFGREIRRLVAEQHGARKLRELAAHVEPVGGKLIVAAFAMMLGLPGASSIAAEVTHAMAADLIGTLKSDGPPSRVRLRRRKKR